MRTRASSRITVCVIAFIAVTAGAQDFAAIDAYVESRMRGHLVPGLALVVVRGDEVIHTRAWGVAGGSRAMTVDTPLVIGSLSKAITATAVLQLVDAGKLELDVPVQQYLPYFRVADADATGSITIRHLLNQTSGIPGDATRAAGENLTLDDHVRALARVRLVGAPGQRHVYSSPNYQVLGRVVEVVSGQELGAYFQDNIFKPLAMNSSFTAFGPARSAGLADGHNLWFGLAGASPYQYEPDRLPTASVITSARDLARFVSAHLGGGVLAGVRVLSADSTARSHRGAAPANGFSYAMGWREGTTAGVASLWHGGALPSYRGAVVLIPQTNLGVVVLTNVSTPFTDHTREIAAGIVALLEGKPQRPPQRPLRQIFFVIAAVSVVILLLQVNSLRKAIVQVKHWSIPMTLAFDVILPLTFLSALPRWIDVSWRGMFESAPDMVVVVWLFTVLGVLTGIIKVVRSRAPSALAKVETGKN